MNQVKIGRFIAKMRKQQNLTQCEFADTLGISNKTVSKWECGNGMPELSLMMPICAVLKININELFSGEKLTDADYKKKAEENIVKLIEESEKIKKNIVGGKVLGKVGNIDMNVSEAHKTNTEFWNTIGLNTYRSLRQIMSKAVAKIKNLYIGEGSMNQVFGSKYKQQYIFGICC